MPNHVVTGKADAAFQHSLEMANWLRAHGNPTAGDDLEHKATILHNQHQEQEQ